MSWKDILVFADGSANGIARARMAAALAEAQGARLEVCVPALMPAPARTLTDIVVGQLAEDAARLARDDAGRAIAAVRDAVPELGERLAVQAPEIRLQEAASFAAGLGRAADVIVTGQPNAADAATLDDALIEGALLGAGRPCLMLPRWEEARPCGARVLVAWKGAREAARAVHDALPIMQRAQSVRVYQSSAGAERDVASGISRLSDHLARHGLRMDQPMIEEAKGAAGEAILAAAERLSADLIVMGGYGHSRSYEFVFGGATRTLMRSSPIAVLFSH
jgi:nucleotide-binding universal stress UspA family protein